MSRAAFDIITVGGGIAGAALAFAMAKQGAEVLVLERETVFKDRVRGEAIMPWGTAEAKELGLYEAIMGSGGQVLRWWDSYVGGVPRGHVDLTSTTEPREGITSIYHPRIQEALITAAADSGAEVRQGVVVKEIQLGSMPAVVADVDGQETLLQTRLIVGADGKDSTVRKWGRFDVHRDPAHNMVAGVLIDDIKVEDDTAHVWLNSDLGLWVLIFPQGHERARGYVCYPLASGYRLTGKKDFCRFIKDSIRAGMPQEHYAKVKAVGPLATFGGAATWVQHPYSNAVALIGGAAADPDPTWGQGLSLSLRDARVLRDQLLRHQDWEHAGTIYAEEHDQYYGAIHEIELWQTQLLLEPGPEADARRRRAFAARREDRTRALDILMSGPRQALDERDKRRFFGEE